MSKSRARGKRSRTVLITGASSGIGRELARIYAANGDDLVLCARRKQNLEELAASIERDHGVAALALPSDLLDPKVPARIQSTGIRPVPA